MNDLQGPFQPKPSYDSMVCWYLPPSQNGISKSSVLLKSSEISYSIFQFNNSTQSGAAVPVQSVRKQMIEGGSFPLHEWHHGQGPPVSCRLLSYWTFPHSLT